MKQVKLGIVIQARTGSSRLPSKIILPFVNNKSILEIVLDKFNIVDFQNIPKVLASSDTKADMILEKYAINAGYKFFRGSETDVLSRFINVGEKEKLTHLIRVCSDNPFLNTPSILVLINELKRKVETEGSRVDYLSFQNGQYIPTIKSHLGLFAEIVSLDALKNVATITNELVYHEHVTNYIYENSNLFNVCLLDAPHCVYNRFDIRLTIDDLNDFNMLANLYKETSVFADDIEQLVLYIDSCLSFDCKKIMIDNIKKYTK